MPKLLSPYILLYIVVMLLQIFFFDNLTFSTSITPLIYIAFLLFMPLKASRLSLLLWGAFLGVTADIMMGMAGVNTIATIFIAYIRIYIIAIFLRVGILNGELVDQGGLDVNRISPWKRTSCFFVLILIHHALFFGIEMLSFDSLSFLVTRTLASSAVTTLFVCLLYALFMRVYSNRNV